jgi:hypothetical protein
VLKFNFNAPINPGWIKGRDECAGSTDANMDKFFLGSQKMSEARVLENHSPQSAPAEMMAFLSDFSRLVDLHVTTVREILLATVDKAMVSVSEINAATDFKLKKAAEVLVKDASGFVSKSAKDLDATFADPTSKVRHVNEGLSSHMAGLSTLDDSVRNCLFAIMGGLSIDDVVRQRLEHISKAMVSMQEGIAAMLAIHSNGAVVTEAQFKIIQQDMLVTMYKAFTMEEEKKIFEKVFGFVSGVNQKP